MPEALSLIRRVRGGGGGGGGCDINISITHIA